MSTTARVITAVELLHMPGDQRRELVKGELRTMAPAGFEHGRVTMKLAKLLVIHVENNKLGIILGAETGFKLSKNPDTVRATDISFVAAARIPAGSHVRGYWEGGPDLAVEVLSPSDSAEEVEEKIDDYLNAGTRLVWILSPRRRTIAVHRGGRDVQLLRDTDTLNGEDVIPGFACKVAEAFD
jgi:Uma2 family endonuclease